MKIVKFSIAGLSLLALFSCNSNNANTNSNEVGSNTSSGADTTQKSDISKDTAFIAEAADGGMMEVELGKIAQTHASNASVKNFGAMMVRDHNKGGEELKALVSGKNIMISDSLSPKSRKMVDELKTKHGTEFDKAYIRMMVSDHKEDIEAFKKEANNPGDPDIGNFASKMLPTLNTHLDSAQAIKQRLMPETSSK